MTPRTKALVDAYKLSVRLRDTYQLNELLNASEKRLRARIGARRVTVLIRRFKAAAAADPKLFAELYAKRSPYDWLARYWAPKTAGNRR